MSKPEAYTTDFPELTRVPYRNYPETLSAGGMEINTVVAHQMLMDLSVKQIAGHRSVHWIAPEAITPGRIIDMIDAGELPPLSYLTEGQQKLACIVKAVRILRHEMEPNPVWATIDELMEDQSFS